MATPSATDEKTSLIPMRLHDLSRTGSDTSKRRAPLAWLLFSIVVTISVGLLCLHRNRTTSSRGSVLAHFNLDKEDKGMNQERFYHDQLVDHFSDPYTAGSTDTWSNRYYQSTEHFGGAGYPIFLVGGGEGAIDDGMLYPFVYGYLAKSFQAAVLQVEHRFYGPHPPVENATVHQLLHLLTPHQALADMVQLTDHVRQTDFGCSVDKDSKHYCPIISVGGSYPGFLSALFRLMYPDFVDIAYASSATLLMYAQAVDQDVYYDIVTNAADRCSPGCADAVRNTLADTVKAIDADTTDLDDAANRLGICTDSIPSYIKNSTMLLHAVIQITSFKFADDNMGNYPPGPETSLYQTCQVFQQRKKDSMERMTDFLFYLLPEQQEEQPNSATCFDLMTQLPKGEGATLEDTDGDYNDGISWDFQTCTQIIFLLGFSKHSMFPTETATYQHLTEHCRHRFGVTPRPWELADEWGLADLSGASNILFVNGLQDMWSGGSYLWNVSDTVIAVNFENGAHHSDLSHALTGPDDDRHTDDVRQGLIVIEETLAKWLREL